MHAMRSSCLISGAFSTMNTNSSIFWILKIIGLVVVARSETWTTNVVEQFSWTPKNDSGNIPLEFFIIGKRVPWSIGKALCSSQHSAQSSNDEDSYQDTSIRKNSTNARKNRKVNDESRLAVLEKDEVRLWFSTMLSESNYRYDGLWIGGHRINSTSDWTWVGTEESEDTAISSSTIIGNYPEWYKINDRLENSKNCLTFDRIGHNLPLLVPSDCQLRKPFVCSRVARKNNPRRIVEGIAISVDGYRYTLYSLDDDDKSESVMTSGIRRLNGGGVKWRDARTECRKRGQYLATVLSNEAANKIASIMLKNRPSMESVWLGGWSSNGDDWTWSTIGSVLPSAKSMISQYPPWLKDHPVASWDLADYDQRHGRCLILDRHLCPDHIRPVFLDLDCEKERPFVCQDGIPEHFDREDSQTLVNRTITVGNRVLEFSSDRMTWNDGQAYCAKNNGRIASILDSMTLSMVLDKMTDLYLDHVWVGGRTERTNEGWRWLDETGKILSRRGIGARTSWCLGDDEATLPKAESNNCLNLDRENHGLPLFYGLSCNVTRQVVLCSLDRDSHKSLSPNKEDEEVKTKVNKEETTVATSGRRSFKPLHTKDSKTNNETEWKIMRPETTGNVSSFNDVEDFERTSDDNNKLRFFDEDKKEERNLTQRIAMNDETKGTRLADLDEETKQLLVASGYNLTDSDLILGLEMEVVDLGENSMINGTDENRIVGK